MDVVIGVDIGQKRDPTALAVVELEWRSPDQRPDRDDHWLVRHLGRLQLGTPYPEVVDQIVRVVGAVQERRARITLYVDATGVGQPVVDLLRAADLAPVACYFVHGERRTQQGSSVNIGKAWLVSRLQAIAQSRRLHLPRTAEAEATRRELLEYEIRVSDDGRDSYGAFKTGTHDDLVTALALAVQTTPPNRPRFYA